MPSVRSLTALRFAAPESLSNVLNSCRQTDPTFKLCWTECGVHPLQMCP